MTTNALDSRDTRDLDDHPHAGALDRTTAMGSVRGTVLILPGRGDVPAYYRRLAARLANDGYSSAIATATIASVDDIVAAWTAEADGVRLIVGVDTSAGILATALVEGALSPAPSGVVFAGIAVAGGDVPADDELAARSACPVHREVVRGSGAAPIAASAVRPVWPGRPDPHSVPPALAIHGGADTIASADAAATLLGGWSAEFTTVAGGLHDVLNDVHHRTVAAEIVGFLERLRADAGAAPILTKEHIA
jgi:hypothetical protein